MEIMVHSLAKNILLFKGCNKLYEQVEELKNIEEQVQAINDVFESMDYETKLALYKKAHNLGNRCQVLILENERLRNAIIQLNEMQTP